MTKLASNETKVLESIPIHDRAKDVKQLVLSEEALPTERTGRIMVRRELQVWLQDQREGATMY